MAAVRMFLLLQPSPFCLWGSATIFDRARASNGKPSAPATAGALAGYLVNLGQCALVSGLSQAEALCGAAQRSCQGNLVGSHARAGGNLLPSRSTQIGGALEHEIDGIR